MRTHDMSAQSYEEQKGLKPRKEALERSSTRGLSCGEQRKAEMQRVHPLAEASPEY